MAVSEFETDVDGNEVTDNVAEVMDDLYMSTACHRVVCSWHKSGRVLYTSKRHGVDRIVFRIAEKHGFKVDHAGRRYDEVTDKDHGYCEFVPAEEAERL